MNGKKIGGIIGIVICCVVYIILITLVVWLMVNNKNPTSVNLTSSSGGRYISVHAGVDSNAEILSFYPNISSLTNALDICRTSSTCEAFKLSKENSTMYVLDTSAVNDISETFSLNENFDIYKLN